MWVHVGETLFSTSDPPSSGDRTRRETLVLWDRLSRFGTKRVTILPGSLIQPSYISFLILLVYSSVYFHETLEMPGMVYIFHNTPTYLSKRSIPRSHLEGSIRYLGSRPSTNL